MVNIIRSFYNLEPREMGTCELDLFGNGENVNEGEGKEINSDWGIVRRMVYPDAVNIR